MTGDPLRTRTTRAGLALTELALGGAQLGNLYSAIDDETAASIVETSWRAGVRYFDTAPHYGVGLSERRLGAILSQQPRDEFVLSTKVGRLLVPDPDATGRDAEGFDVPATTRRVRDYSRDGILRSVDESLERLGLDRIDVVYVHDPDDFADQAIAEAIPALVELRDQGVVTAVGVGMNQSDVPARCVRETDIDLVMLAGRYTLLDQSGADDLLSVALERGVGVVAAGVFNSGILAGDRAAADATYDYGPADADLITRANAIADVCDDHGVSLPEAAIAFPLRHPAILSVVLGAADGDQAAENARRYATTPPEGLWRDLDARGLVPAPLTTKENR